MAIKYIVFTTLVDSSQVVSLEEWTPGTKKRLASADGAGLYGFEGAEAPVPHKVEAALPEDSIPIVHPWQVGTRPVIEKWDSVKNAMVPVHELVPKGAVVGGETYNLFSAETIQDYLNTHETGYRIKRQEDGVSDTEKANDSTDTETKTEVAGV